MLIEECYDKMQRECGIEVGDTVKVLRKAEDYEFGWGTIWDRDMDSMVGKEYIVQKVDSEDGFFLIDDSRGDEWYSNEWYFPFFVLELVKKKQKIDLSDLDTVIKLHKEMWDWLAEDPRKRTKYDWPGFEEYDLKKEIIHQYCFLCEYVNRKIGECAHFDCEINCPGKWGDYRLIHGISGCSPCQNGEFGFYELSLEFTKSTLERVYRRIRDICD